MTQGTYIDDVEPLRVRLLRTAIKLTFGDRDEEYGPPKVNLQNCAELVSAYLNCKRRTAGDDFSLTASDMAWINTLIKIARTFSGNSKTDTYIDAAAYAAIAGECAFPDKKPLDNIAVEPGPYPTVWEFTTHIPGDKPANT